MFIFKDTLKRANENAAYVDSAGTKYSTIPRELLTEIPEPQTPTDYSEDLYYRTEQEDAPYVVYERKPEEQIHHIIDNKAKDAAELYLISTDYLFYSDRHDILLIEEPVREQELRVSRESARQIIQDHKIKYPSSLS